MGLTLPFSPFSPRITKQATLFDDGASNKRQTPKDSYFKTSRLTVAIIYFLSAMLLMWKKFTWAIQQWLDHICFANFDIIVGHVQRRLDCALAPTQDTSCADLRSNLLQYKPTRVSRGPAMVEIHIESLSCWFNHVDRSTTWSSKFGFFATKWTRRTHSPLGWKVSGSISTFFCSKASALPPGNVLLETATFCCS
jgi:hypothetical protein